jgi:hypothetical protein
MGRGAILIFVIALIILLGLGYYLLWGGGDTYIETAPRDEPVREGAPDRHVMAGGKLRFDRPTDFGLAVTAEQVPALSVIPPCTEGFDYCLYYNEDAYDNTNFESAGLRIERRDDLTTETSCLNTPPAGYSALTPEVRNEQSFELSTYSPIQDSATGHSSEGELYRLHFDSSCYEFETRIGVSRFENFEEGSIDEFTMPDRAELERKLRNLLQTIRFVENEDGIILACRKPGPAV